MGFLACLRSDLWTSTKKSERRATGKRLLLRFVTVDRPFHSIVSAMFMISSIVHLMAVTPAAMAGVVLTELCTFKKL